MNDNNNSNSRPDFAGGHMTTGEWLHPVLEKMPDGVAVVVNGKIVYSNTPLSDMLHLRHDFIQGKPIVEIFHPKEIDLSLERMEDVITGGPEYSSEAQLISREGKTIPVEFFTRKLNYESETIGLLCVFRDLTVDKRIEDALGEVEARYHTLVEHAPEAILVYDANTHRFVDANEKALWLFGRDRQSIMEVGFDEVSEPLPSDQHTVQEFLADKIEKTLQGDVMDFEWTCINSSGKQVPCEVRLVQLPVKGRSLIRASLTDITGRKAAENALRESEERYALSARGANDGLWDWDLIADEIHYSPRWKEMLGYKDDEIGRGVDEWFGRVHPEDQQLLRDAINQHIEGKSPHFEAEYRIKRAHGDLAWVLSRGLVVRSQQGEAYRMAGSQTDITTRKLAEAQLVRDAMFDALTGLPNRTQFLERLDYAIEKAQSNPGYEFAVLFLDLDRFKKINDSCGHLVGDDLLIETARRLESCVQPKDIVARLAGDEFALLLDDIINRDYPSQIAERILKELAFPFSLGGKKIYISASVGIALNERHHAKAQQLIKEADTAMYFAKRKGKARYMVFDPESHGYPIDLIQMEADLRRALHENEFELYYEPVVSLEHGRISGVEAFIRWKHPERGLVLPGEFIKLAEELGLIAAIDNWVLENACAQLKDWQSQGIAPQRMVVNISLQQFKQPDLAEIIRSTLDKFGLHPKCLELELLETVLMDDMNESVEAINRLKGLGVMLSIDDFGAVYSSLSYLKRFSVHAIRIDKSLLAEVSQDEDTASIVAAIISLANSLQLLVIAEGIETKDQLDFVRLHQAGEVQGYLFGPPMPVEQMTIALSKDNGIQALID